MKDTSLVNKHDRKFASSLTDKLFTQNGAIFVGLFFCATAPRGFFFTTKRESKRKMKAKYVHLQRK